ncbi:N-formylglutamate amidohydrolase, partial [Streptomyces violaceoruber]
PAQPLPYELHGGGPRPPVCLGTDAFHTPPGLLAAAREAFAPCGETGLDSPFSGTYVPLGFYGTRSEVGALMVEIRRDTYMTEPGGPAGPGLSRLAGSLAALVDAVSG